MIITRAFINICTVHQGIGNYEGTDSAERSQSCSFAPLLRTSKLAAQRKTVQLSRNGSRLAQPHEDPLGRGQNVTHIT